MRSPFSVLYRLFLFRVVDLEVLSAQGDISKLLGQICAMLVALSFMFSLGAMRAGSRIADATAATWGNEHFLVATTMLVVGLFAVLSWDAAFPDRRDIYVLGPLPVSPGTIFLAKAAAMGTAMSVAIVAVNVFTGLLYSLGRLASGGSLLSSLQGAVAYWTTMFAAGLFVMGGVLLVQGILSQALPRQLFLRVSGFLQIFLFFLTVSVYFLQPPLATPELLADPANQCLTAWLPSYWFFGLLHLLNGEMLPQLNALAARALGGVAVSLLGAALAFLLSYSRTIRRTVEQPDIVPQRKASGLLPAFGDSLHTAVVQFAVRSAIRSRQHRVILAWYLGVGFAFSLAYAKSLCYGNSPYPWYVVNEQLLMVSVVMLCFAVVGVRAVAALPLELRSNWVFRITSVDDHLRYLSAIRRSLFVLGVLPVWLPTVLLLLVWPALPVLAHLILLGILGSILVDLALYNFPKIPFTCSFLPGRANVHVMSGAYVIVLFAIAELGVRIEIFALGSLTGYLKYVAVASAIAFWAWRRTRSRVRNERTTLRFEETGVRDVLSLQLRPE